MVHALPLRDAAGGGERAVMIEPAGPPELAPLIAQTHELSDRERQVTELLAQGLAVDEIARALVVSVHTVRDHVKAVFSKLGVRSRPELTARLFAEHYGPGILSTGR